MALAGLRGVAGAGGAGLNLLLALMGKRLSRRIFIIITVFLGNQFGVMNVRFMLIEIYCWRAEKNSHLLAFGRWLCWVIWSKY